MIGASCADFGICRIRSVCTTTGISDRRFEDCFIFDGPSSQKDVLDAPEAAGSKGGNLRRGNGGGHVLRVLGYV